MLLLFSMNMAIYSTISLFTQLSKFLGYWQKSHGPLLLIFAIFSSLPREGCGWYARDGREGFLRDASLRDA